MTIITILSIAVFLIFAALSWLAIWQRRTDLLRHIAVGLCVLGLPLLSFTALESLSWSRPLWAMWGLSGDLRILGAKMVEGDGIYVYADTGEGEPRAIKIPWDTQTAEDLQDLFDNPANGGQAMMRFEEGLDIERPPTFYAIPQPAPPPKEPAPVAPHLDI